MVWLVALLLLGELTIVQSFLNKFTLQRSHHLSRSDIRNPETAAIILKQVHRNRCFLMVESVRNEVEENRLSKLEQCGTDKEGSFQKSIVSDGTRRKLLALCPAVGIALSQEFNFPTAAAALETDNSINLEQVPALNIIPFSSVRKQKIVTLSNGLKALLVNDKRASQSTAAVVITGPGQFTDPYNLPGLAHLMEHMILSCNTTSTRNSAFRSINNYVQGGDLEDWLGDRGGASNAFTAYQETCFHINCPHDILGKALEKFAAIFEEGNVMDSCSDAEVLAREIRRVDAELDLDTIIAKKEYVTKSFVNSEHPYSRFSRGNKISLETIPNEEKISVKDSLINFFQKYYLPTQAILVVVGNQQQDFSTLERMVSPFSDSLSKRRRRADFGAEGNHFPGRFLQGKRYKHLLLYREENSLTSVQGNEKLTLQWVLNEDYRRPAINNAVEIAFVLNQILGRRGPGSLYLFLRKRGWIQNGSSSLPPQFSVRKSFS